MKIVLWLLGGLLIALGVHNLHEGQTPLAMIAGIACGIVLLPPVNQKYKAPKLAYALVFFVGMGAVLYDEAKQGDQQPLTAVRQKGQDSLNAAKGTNQKVASDVYYSYIKARRAIKKTLKDPDSFDEIEHKEMYVGKDGIYAACQITYRAKNSFGALDVAKAVVTFNKKMEPISVNPVD